tara:strand:+ start:93 stop:503 length:411 start_codon:yes stop_codon:yes gene_type:complete
MISATEISQKIDLGFDYANLIRFSNEDELKKEYGEEFYKKFVEAFADEWFWAIGDTLQYVSVPEVVSKCVNKVAKDFAEIEEGEVLRQDWEDEVEDEEDLPKIQSNKDMPYFRTNQNGGRQNFNKVSDWSDERGIL